MSGFFRKLLYGDGSKKDFSAADLPRTRAQVYKRLIKTQSGRLLRANWWMLLFCLPFFAWNIVCLSYGSSFDVTTAEGQQQYTNFLLTIKYPFTMLGIVIAFLGFCGLIFLVRNMCWGLPTSVTRTYFRGIKSSWWQFLLIGLITSVIWCLFDYAFILLNFSSLATLQLILIYAVMVFAIVMLLGGLMFAVNLISTYKMSMFSVVKNSFLLSVKYFLKCLGILCITVLPIFLLEIFGIVLLNIIAYVLLALFGFVHIAIVWHLFTNSVFDNHINKKSYPDFYRKGLSPQKTNTTTKESTGVIAKNESDDEIK